MKIFLYFAAGWFLLVWGYVVVMHAQHLIDDRGEKLTLFWKSNLYPLAIVAKILDFAFNVVVGTALYLELPHEMMFTSRCKRWVKIDVNDETSYLWIYRATMATWWQKQLNQIRPGHV